MTSGAMDEKVDADLQKCHFSRIPLGSR